MWQRDPNFQEFLRGAWSDASREHRSFAELQVRCAKRLDGWNRAFFGNVQGQIGKWKKELEIVKGKVVRSEEVIQKESEISDTIDEWLAREELLWRQRSKLEWLKDGDRNTTFFHAKASHRRSSNMIRELLTKGGFVVIREDDLLREGEAYFREVFRANNRVDIVDWERVLGGVQRKVTADMNCRLGAPYTAREVTNAIFQMNPLKAPGKDDFSAAFYQKNWAIVGEDVCRVALRFLNDGVMEEELNETRIVLIPKCKGAKMLKDFRPISLVNVIMN